MPVYIQKSDNGKKLASVLGISQQAVHKRKESILKKLKKIVTIQNNKKIVYLHKRNFDISNSRHADDRNTNWSYAMLSRDTKNAS